MRRVPTAILISGRGSNMAALLAAAADPAYPAEIVLVLSSRPDAAGLAHAVSRGVKVAVVDQRDHRGGFRQRRLAPRTRLGGHRNVRALYWGERP